MAKLLTLLFLTKKAKNQHLKILKKPYFYSVFEQQAKKENSQKKAITLAHATITCLVKNTRKYFHFFGGVFFLVSVFVGFAKLNNITTQKHSNQNKKTPKINKNKNQPKNNKNKN